MIDAEKGQAQPEYSATDASFSDAVEAAGLSHLLQEYEPGLRKAMHDAQQHADLMKSVLALDDEPALIFTPSSNSCNTDE